MHCSSSSLLRELSPAIPAALVGARQLEACVSVANTVPPGAAATYLECRLDADQRVDYLTLTRERRSALDGFSRSRCGLRSSSVWDRNCALLAAWSRGDAEIAEIPWVWFEYDVDERFDPQVLDASPSLCVERGYHLRESKPPPINSRRARRLASAVLEQLLAASDGVARDAALGCIDALPEAGALIHISRMFARTLPATKLYLSLPKREVLDYLRRVAWPGDVALLEEVLGSWYGPITSTAFIDLTVGSEVQPRIGLALSQLHRRELAEFDPAWRWVPMSGVEPCKRRALEAWPGASEARLDGTRVWLQRWLDLKVVLHESGALEHKAYLGFSAALPPAFA